MRELQEPWFESSLFDVERTRRVSGDEAARVAARMATDGFALLPGVVPPELIERALDDMVDRFDGEGRIQDLWRTSDAVRGIACLPAVLDLLEATYGRRPMPFQTLNFMVGTEQKGHSDVLHFSSIPSGFMCGVWVALEDIDADNGPLFYFPGSHRLPDATLQRFGLETGFANYERYADMQEGVLLESGFERVEFHAKAGDALVWSSNLVHGGRPIADPGRTRWSQVTHYFFDGCFYVTPLLSEPDLGEWFVREGLVDIATGLPIEHSYMGSPIHLEPLGEGRSRVLRSPPGTDADDAVQDQLDAVLAELDAVKRSRSYRIGRMVSAPARSARRIVDRLRRHS